MAITNCLDELVDVLDRISKLSGTHEIINDIMRGFKQAVSEQNIDKIIGQMHRLDTMLSNYTKSPEASVYDASIITSLNDLDTILNFKESELDAQGRSIKSNKLKQFLYEKLVNQINKPNAKKTKQLSSVLNTISKASKTETNFSSVLGVLVGSALTADDKNMVNTVLNVVMMDKLSSWRDTIKLDETGKPLLAQQTFFDGLQSVSEHMYQTHHMLYTPPANIPVSLNEVVQQELSSRSVTIEDTVAFEEASKKFQYYNEVQLFNAKAGGNVSYELTELLSKHLNKNYSRTPEKAFLVTEFRGQVLDYLTNQLNLPKNFAEDISDAVSVLTYNSMYLPPHSAASDTAFAQQIMSSYGYSDYVSNMVGGALAGFIRSSSELHANGNLGVIRVSNILQSLSPNVYADMLGGAHSVPKLTNTLMEVSNVSDGDVDLKTKEFHSALMNTFPMLRTLDDNKQSIALQVVLQTLQRKANQIINLTNTTLDDASNIFMKHFVNENSVTNEEGITYEYYDQTTTAGIVQKLINTDNKMEFNQTVLQNMDEEDIRRLETQIKFIKDTKTEYVQQAVEEQQDPYVNLKTQPTELKGREQNELEQWAYVSGLVTAIVAQNANSMFAAIVAQNANSRFAADETSNAETDILKKILGYQEGENSSSLLSFLKHLDTTRFNQASILAQEAIKIQTTQNQVVETLINEDLKPLKEAIEKEFAKFYKKPNVYDNIQVQLSDGSKMPMKIEHIMAFLLGGNANKELIAKFYARQRGRNTDNKITWQIHSAMYDIGNTVFDKSTLEEIRNLHKKLNENILEYTNLAHRKTFGAGVRAVEDNYVPVVQIITPEDTNENITSQYIVHSGHRTNEVVLKNPQNAKLGFFEAYDTHIKSTARAAYAVPFQEILVQAALDRKMIDQYAANTYTNASDVYYREGLDVIRRGLGVEKKLQSSKDIKSQKNSTIQKKVFGVLGLVNPTSWAKTISSLIFANAAFTKEEAAELSVLGGVESEDKALFTSAWKEAQKHVGNEIDFEMSGVGISKPLFNRAFEKISKQIVDNSIGKTNMWVHKMIFTKVFKAGRARGASNSDIINRFVEIAGATQPSQFNMFKSFYLNSAEAKNYIFNNQSSKIHQMFHMWSNLAKNMGDKKLANKLQRNVFWAGSAYAMAGTVFNPTAFTAGVSGNISTVLTRFGSQFLRSIFPVAKGGGKVGADPRVSATARMGQEVVQLSTTLGFGLASGNFIPATVQIMRASVDAFKTFYTFTMYNHMRSKLQRNEAGEVVFQQSKKDAIKEYVSKKMSVTDKELDELAKVITSNVELEYDIAASYFYQNTATEEQIAEKQKRALETGRDPDKNPYASQFAKQTFKEQQAQEQAKADLMEYARIDEVPVDDRNPKPYTEKQKQILKNIYNK